MITSTRRPTKKYIRDGRAPIPRSETTSRIMSAIRARGTVPELILRRAIYKVGLRGYRSNWKGAPGRPDICHPGKKVAIFMHGCFWHRCPHCKPAIPRSHISFWKSKFKNNIERDKRKEKELKDSGWRVLTLWECQIKKNLDKCVSRIAAHY